MILICTVNLEPGEDILNDFSVYCLFIESSMGLSGHVSDADTVVLRHKVALVFLATTLITNTKRMNSNMFSVVYSDLTT